MRSPFVFAGAMLATACLFAQNRPHASAAHTVDMNTATVHELVTDLPDMTVESAQAIVAHRPYASLADLQRSAIPETQLKKWEGLMKFSQPTETPAQKDGGHVAFAPNHVMGTTGSRNPAAQSEADMTAQANSSKMQSADRVANAGSSNTGSVDRMAQVGQYTGAMASASSGPSGAKAATGAGSAASAANSDALTNDQVVNMEQSGLQSSAIIEVIREAPRVEFDLSPDGLVGLGRAGVPKNVISAMRARVNAGNSVDGGRSAGRAK